LRCQALADGGRIVAFAEGSRAKRRFVNSGQGGDRFSGYGGAGGAVALRAVDCPADASPNLAVVRACLRGDFDPSHDLRFAVKTHTISESPVHLN
jgi:hypothetical protein